MIRNAFRRVGPALAPMPAAALAHAAPRLELGESRPLETALGNPEIREARTIWVGMIRGAKRPIDLEHLCLSHRSDESLRPVLHELGVRVDEARVAPPGAART